LRAQFSNGRSSGLAKATFLRAVRVETTLARGVHRSHLRKAIVKKSAAVQLSGGRMLASNNGGQNPQAGGT
jgi:hypothetical protein